MLSMLAGRRSWLGWMLAFPAAAFAQVPGGDVILAQNARMTLTRADYETALARLVPEDRRADFASSPKLIDGLLNTLLVRKTLAGEARETGLDREPLPQGADEDAVLAERFLVKLDVEAQADFDRRIEVFTAKAREDYLVGRRTYVTPEEVEFSQVFVDSAKRGDEAALAIAKKVRTELRSGAAFAALAREYSDDEASAANSGRVSWVSRAGLDPVLASALFAMKEANEGGEVVRTQTGYYVVRLEGRRPGGRQQTFDEVKERILAKMKEAHVQARRSAKAEAIAKDPMLFVNQPAIDALLIPGDPEAIRRALQALPPETPRN